jgi:ActR/RegA family two-component response regulator
MNLLIKLTNAKECDVMSTKVLIVDDEKDFLEVLGERMTVRGMDVQTTTSAKDAEDFRGADL